MNPAPCRLSAQDIAARRPHTSLAQAVPHPPHFFNSSWTGPALCAGPGGGRGTIQSCPHLRHLLRQRRGGEEALAGDFQRCFGELRAPPPLDFCWTGASWGSKVSSPSSMPAITWLSLASVTKSPASWASDSGRPMFPAISLERPLRSPVLHPVFVLPLLRPREVTGPNSSPTWQQVPVWKKLQLWVGWQGHGYFGSLMLAPLRTQYPQQFLHGIPCKEARRQAGLVGRRECWDGDAAM